MAKQYQKGSANHLFWTHFVQTPGSTEPVLPQMRPVGWMIPADDPDEIAPYLTEYLFRDLMDRNGLVVGRDEAIRILEPYRERMREFENSIRSTEDSTGMESVNTRMAADIMKDILASRNIEVADRPLSQSVYFSLTKFYDVTRGLRLVPGQKGAKVSDYMPCLPLVDTMKDGTGAYILPDGMKSAVIHGRDISVHTYSKDGHILDDYLTDMRGKLLFQNAVHGANGLIQNGMTPSAELTQTEAVMRRAVYKGCAAYMVQMYDNDMPFRRSDKAMAQWVYGYETPKQPAGVMRNFMANVNVLNNIRMHIDIPENGPVKMEQTAPVVGLSQSSASVVSKAEQTATPVSNRKSNVSSADMKTVDPVAVRTVALQPFEDGRLQEASSVLTPEQRVRWLNLSAAQKNAQAFVGNSVFYKVWKSIAEQQLSDDAGLANKDDAIKLKEACDISRKHFTDVCALGIIRDNQVRADILTKIFKDVRPDLDIEITADMVAPYHNATIATAPFVDGQYATGSIEITPTDARFTDLESVHRAGSNGVIVSREAFGSLLNKGLHNCDTTVPEIDSDNCVSYSLLDSAVADKHVFLVSCQELLTTQPDFEDKNAVATLASDADFCGVSRLYGLVSDSEYDEIRSTAVKRFSDVMDAKPQHMSFDQYCTSLWGGKVRIGFDDRRRNLYLRQHGMYRVGAHILQQLRNAGVEFSMKSDDYGWTANISDAARFPDKPNINVLTKLGREITQGGVWISGVNTKYGVNSHMYNNGKKRIDKPYVPYDMAPIIKKSIVSDADIRKDNGASALENMAFMYAPSITRVDAILRVGFNQSQIDAGFDRVYKVDSVSRRGASLTGQKFFAASAHDGNVSLYMEPNVIPELAPGEMPTDGSYPRNARTHLTTLKAVHYAPSFPSQEDAFIPTTVESGMGITASDKAFHEFWTRHANARAKFADAIDLDGLQRRAMEYLNLVSEGEPVRLSDIQVDGSDAGIRRLQQSYLSVLVGESNVLPSYKAVENEVDDQDTEDLDADEANLDEDTTDVDFIEIDPIDMSKYKSGEGATEVFDVSRYMDDRRKAIEGHLSTMVESMFGHIEMANVPGQPPQKGTREYAQWQSRVTELESRYGTVSMPDHVPAAPRCSDFKCDDIGSNQVRNIARYGSSKWIIESINELKDMMSRSYSTRFEDGKPVYTAVFSQQTTNSIGNIEGLAGNVRQLYPLPEGETLSPFMQHVTDTILDSMKSMGYSVNADGDRACQIMMDEYGHIDWYGWRHVVSNVDTKSADKQDTYLRGKLGPVFEPISDPNDPHFGCVFVRTSLEDEPLELQNPSVDKNAWTGHWIAPGCSAYIVPNKPGEHASVEQRTRVSNYETSLLTTIRNQIMVDSCVASPSVSSIGDVMFERMANHEELRRGRVKTVGSYASLEKVLRKSSSSTKYEKHHLDQYIEAVRDTGARFDYKGTQYETAVNNYLIQVTSVQSNVERIRYSNKVKDESTTHAEYAHNHPMDGSAVDKLNDRNMDIWTMTGGQNMAVMLAKSKTLFDNVATATASNQGIVRYLSMGARFQSDGRIVPAVAVSEDHTVTIPLKDGTVQTMDYTAYMNEFDADKVDIDRMTPDMIDDTGMGCTRDLLVNGRQLVIGKDGLPGRIVNPREKQPVLADGERCVNVPPINPYILNDASDRQIMTLSNLTTALKVTQPVGVAHMICSGWNCDDGNVVSRRFADNHPVKGADGVMRSLQIGDKISDFHGNKGVIGAIVDPYSDESSGAEMDNLKDIFRNNPDLDVITSPFPSQSRFNAGTNKECMERIRAVRSDPETLERVTIGFMDTTAVYGAIQDHRRDTVKALEERYDMSIGELMEIDAVRNQFDKALAWTKEDRAEFERQARPIYAEHRRLYDAYCAEYPVRSIEDAANAVAYVADAMTATPNPLKRALSEYGKDWVAAQLNGAVDNLISLKDLNGTRLEPGTLARESYIITDKTVDTKSHMYAGSDSVGKGRKASTQLLWTGNAQKIPAVLSEIYGSNSRPFAVATDTLRVLGYELDSTGHITTELDEVAASQVNADVASKMNLLRLPTELPSTTGDNYRQVKEFRKNCSEVFNKMADDVGGFMEVPFPLMPIGRSGATDVSFAGPITDEIRSRMVDRNTEIPVNNEPVHHRLPNSSSATIDGNVAHAVSNDPTYRIPLISPYFRRGCLDMDSDMEKPSPVTKWYSQIYTNSVEYLVRKSMRDEATSSDIRDRQQKEMDQLASDCQSYYDKICDHVTERLTQKNSNIFRAGVMENKLPESATAVWAANPTCDLDEIAMSSKTARTLGYSKEDIRTAIKNREKIQQMYKDADKPGFEFDEKPMVESPHILVWRDPALRTSALRYMRLRIDDSIEVGVQINPATDKCFDGDFDGDSVGLAPLKTDAAKQQAMEKLSFSANMLDNGLGRNGAKPLNFLGGLDMSVIEHEQAKDNGGVSAYADRRADITAKLNEIDMSNLPQSERVSASREQLFRLNKLQHEMFSDRQYSCGAVLNHMSPQSIVESVYAACIETGAKGNPKKMRAWMEYFGFQECDASEYDTHNKECVKLDGFSEDAETGEKKPAHWVYTGIPCNGDMDKLTHMSEEVLYALCTKTYGTGTAGAFPIRSVQAFRDTDALADSLEIAYCATQSMLQAKHDAADARRRFEMLQGPLRDLWRGYEFDMDATAQTGEWTVKRNDSGYPVSLDIDNPDTPKIWQKQCMMMYTGSYTDPVTGVVEKLPNTVNDMSVDISPDVVSRMGASMIALARVRDQNTLDSKHSGKMFNLDMDNKTMASPIDVLAYQIVNKSKDQVRETIHNMALGKTDLFGTNAAREIMPEKIRENRRQVEQNVMDNQISGWSKDWAMNRGTVPLVDRSSTGANRKLSGLALRTEILFAKDQIDRLEQYFGAKDTMVFEHDIGLDVDKHVETGLRMGVVDMPQPRRMAPVFTPSIQTSVEDYARVQTVPSVSNLMKHASKVSKPTVNVEPQVDTVDKPLGLLDRYQKNEADAVARQPNVDQAMSTAQLSVSESDDVSKSDGDLGDN